MLPLKVRGHIDKLWINREMGQAAPKGKERFARIAIRAVLLNSILHVLSRERVLEFGGEDRQAIEEEHEIQALVVFLPGGQLANFAEAIPGLKGQQLVVQ